MSFILIATNNLCTLIVFILNATMLGVVVLNVVAPSTKLLGRRQNKLGSGGSRVDKALELEIQFGVC